MDLETWQWVLSILVLNAILGLVCVEWAWKQVKSLRDGND